MEKHTVLLGLSIILAVAFQLTTSFPQRNTVANTQVVNNVVNVNATTPNITTSNNPVINTPTGTLPPTNATNITIVCGGAPTPGGGPTRVTCGNCNCNCSSSTGSASDSFTSLVDSINQLLTITLNNSDDIIDSLSLLLFGNCTTCAQVSPDDMEQLPLSVGVELP